MKISEHYLIKTIKKTKKTVCKFNKLNKILFYAASWYFLTILLILLNPTKTIVKNHHFS